MEKKHTSQFNAEQPLMKLRKIGEDKRGLSNIVAYVLLISITVALSVMVYNWLRFYVTEEEIPACPEGVNVIISDHKCFANDKVEITLKNKGRFTVDGFILRVHDRPDAEFGFYTLNSTGARIAPGEEHQTIGFIDGSIDPEYDFASISIIEIQPYMTDAGNISCKAIATQSINTCI